MLAGAFHSKREMAAILPASDIDIRMDGSSQKESDGLGCLYPNLNLRKCNMLRFGMLARLAPGNRKVKVLWTGELRSDRWMSYGIVDAAAAACAARKR
jgi:hypothetical protein